MGTYETISDLDEILNEVSTSTKKKNKRPKNVISEKSTLMAYSLLQNVANGIIFFGKIKEDKVGKATAEFICSCGNTFRSELKPILSGKIKTCGCKIK